MKYKVSVIVILFYIHLAVSLSDRKFPSGFKFGTASSSYQVEGAWNEDGKGLNIFDIFLHKASNVDGSNGDVACDSYHKYKEDVALLKNLGVHYYRFSISWARIMPSGFSNKINDAGVQYYKNLISALKSVGIEPYVTLFHWDLPLTLQLLGGWTSSVMVDYYVSYADFVFKTFGGDVKIWFTLNEPTMFCNSYIPLMSDPNYSGINEYLCGHNMLLAHAKAYRLYNEKYRATQGGKVTIDLNLEWYEPANSSNPSDVEAAERKRLFDFGWFAHPIVYGNYPQVMIDRIRNRSLEEKFYRSRLPTFTKQQSELIKGTYDFIAFNHYSTLLTQNDDALNGTRFQNDVAIVKFQDPSWIPGASTWLKIVPWGFRKILNWVKDTYNNPEIVITENGYSDHGELNDGNRIIYIQEYLSAALDAIYEDKVKLIAYTYWSLLDSFEWLDGYTVKFGLYHVDFNDPQRTRTPKNSTNYYRDIIKTNCLSSSCVS